MYNKQMDEPKICKVCKEKKPESKFTSGIKRIRRSATCNKCTNYYFRINNLASIKLNAKRYSISPKGIYHVINVGAKQRNLSICSLADFKDWYSKQPQICFYCKRTLEQISKMDVYFKVRRLTIDRMDNKIGYEVPNMALACFRCNTIIKNSFFSKEEMIKIGKIISSKVGK